MKNKKPDWKNASDYPENCTIDRWSYEFELRGAPKLRDSIPSDAISKHARQELGIDAPVIYLHSPWGLAPIPPNEEGQQFFILPRNYDHQRHIGLLFCLDDDLDEQIKRAHKSLKSLQKDLYSTPTVRKIATKYRTYLRLIDARKAGATAEQMAKFIFPYIENINPDYLARKRVMNGLKAAERILKNGVEPPFARKEK